ncbi:hypothetical protein [Fodinibius sediminis]|nr:hypothetical protein [Fodinibius sediminis]
MDFPIPIASYEIYLHADVEVELQAYNAQQSREPLTRPTKRGYLYHSG